MSDPYPAIKTIHHKDFNHIVDQELSITGKDFNQWIRKDPEYFLERLSFLFEKSPQEALAFFSEEQGNKIINDSIKKLPKKSRNLTRAAALNIIKRYKN